VSPPRFIKIIGSYIHYAAVVDVQVVSGETETIAFTPALPSAMTNIVQVQELLFVRSNTDNFDIEVTSREFSSLRAYCKIPIIEIPDNIPA
jgi:predicted regulator of amino acid metabolism with ACT domain